MTTACLLPLQVGAHFAKDAFSSFVVNPLGNAVQDQVTPLGCVP